MSPMPRSSQKVKPQTGGGGSGRGEGDVFPEPGNFDDTQEIIRSYERNILEASSTGESDIEGGNIEDDAPTFHHPVQTEPVEAGQLTDCHIEPWEDNTTSASWVDVSSAPEPLYGHAESSLHARSPETLSAAHILAGSSAILAYSVPFSLGQAVSRNASPLPEPSFVITDREQATLISAFLRESGTWCETTDSKMQFTVNSVHKMMENKAYLAAALALSSRQLDEVNRRKTQLTLELYQHTIQLLLHHDPAEADESILATCTLLCVYEMMASGVSEWRRHLRGCASFLKMRGWNGSTGGIVKACFWAFARIDIWAAYIINQTTLIPSELWVHDDCASSVAASGDLDDYCNLAIVAFSKVVNLLSENQRSRRSSPVQFAIQVEKSWNELQAWRRFRPRETLPLCRMEASESSPFPTVIYAQSSSICGNTFYHAGSILLLQTGLVGPTSDPREVLDPVFHAREIAAISICNNSHANWVNHLQPLYIAGTVFGSSDRYERPNRTDMTSGTDGNSPHSGRRTNGSGLVGDLSEGLTEGSRSIGLGSEEFAAEKIALLKQLTRIEKQTGWKTSERARDLRVLWGLEY
ncbi:hypothetical protein jhhlp_002762 [Lomentospora prolificans]|uniref:Transcription factor domain-containing protein n=1 Tax=Lomentospora prolificans TaxID=41688 RepID=A0A2N3NEZ0_9PEZI|nr:hypothetical protein jhhlp_002762 [Lomentospora prolificans]